MVRPLRARNPLWIQESAGYPSPIRLANKVGTVFNRRVASEVGALVDDIRPDVLHTHSMVELPPAVWDQAARRGVAVVHTLHDYDLLCIRGALFKDGRKCEPRHAVCRILSAPKRAMHDRIDAVAAVSRAVLETHVAHGLFTHLSPERRRVIWNPARCASPSRSRKARPAGEPLRLGFLGRLASEKGLGPLLAACRLLPPTAAWTLRVAGDGAARPLWEEQARGLPVRFEGYVEAARFLADIDVLICVPLWDEPFGLTTLEAYAAGCRVIGSNGGAIGELVEQIEPGWTVPPGDLSALTGVLLRAIDENTALAPDRQPAVNALLAQLAPRTVAQTYLDLYHAALGTSPALRAANE